MKVHAAAFLMNWQPDHSCYTQHHPATVRHGFTFQVVWIRGFSARGNYRHYRRVGWGKKPSSTFLSPTHKFLKRGSGELLTFSTHHIKTHFLSDFRSGDCGEFRCILEEQSHECIGFISSSRGFVRFMTSRSHVRKESLVSAVR